MRRRNKWTCVLAVMLSLLLAGAEVLAVNKSRPRRRTTVAKHSARGRDGGRRISRRDKSGRRRDRRGRTLARSRRRPRHRYSPPDAASTQRPAGGSIAAERVIQIQNALAKAGYFEGPVTGQYDDATIQAMKQFQADKRLPVTGLPSAHSLKLLGVPKRSDNSFAVPVKSVAEGEKKHSPPKPGASESKP